MGVLGLQAASKENTGCDRDVSVTLMEIDESYALGVRTQGLYRTWQSRRRDNCAPPLLVQFMRHAPPGGNDVIDKEAAHGYPTGLAVQNAPAA